MVLCELIVTFLAFVMLMDLFSIPKTNDETFKRWFFILVATFITLIAFTVAFFILKFD